MPEQRNDQRSGSTSLAAVLPRVAKQALGKRGFAEGTLLTDWAAIVGTEIAACSVPLKLAYDHGERRDGTLHVRVAGAAALELQHLEPMILERINGSLGYRAVARLRIEQGPLPGAERKPPPGGLEGRCAEADGAAEPALEDVQDPALRESLARLDRAIRGVGR